MYIICKVLGTNTNTKTKQNIHTKWKIHLLFFQRKEISENKANEKLDNFVSKIGSHVYYLVKKTYAILYYVSTNMYKANKFKYNGVIYC